jgi:hypothetical protein
MKRNRKYIATLAVLLSMCAGAGRAQVQSLEKDETDARLKMHVHLSLGKTTVARATAALSTQTGLTVTAADFLQKRTLIVQLDNVSAGAALAALAELNDWTWYETQPNHILLTRRKLRLPPEPDNITPLMQATMPADLREYIGIARPVEDVRQIIQKPRLFDNSAGRRMQGYRIPIERLLDTLNAENLTQNPLPYEKLSQVQRDYLLAIVVFGEMNMFGQGIMSNNTVYEFDPSNCELSILPNNSIGVSTIATDRSRTPYGFGFSFGVSQPVAH